MQTTDLIFGFTHQTVALAAMGLCYFLLFTEKLNRAVVTLLVGAGLVLCGAVSQEAAIAAIDFNTISLLTGMMIIINIAERTGMFQYVAVWGAKKVRAHPLGILIVMGFVTAVFSAFLDNVTTVLLVVPVTMQIANKLEVNPYPYLLINIFASNIGGTATLIGDPPNILIGSALELSFTDFLFHLTPVVLTIMAAVVGMFVYFWKDSLTTSLKNRALVMNINEKDEITDFKLLKKALWVLGMVMAAFVVAHDIGFENGFIALAGAAVMLLLYTMGLPHTQSDEKVEDVLRRVDWTTVFFFVGLFVIVGALDESGFLKKMGDYFVGVTCGSIKKSVYVILGVSAAASASALPPARQRRPSAASRKLPVRSRPTCCWVQLWPKVLQFSASSLLCSSSCSWVDNGGMTNADSESEPSVYSRQHSGSVFAAAQVPVQARHEHHRTAPEAGG